MANRYPFWGPWPAGQSARPWVSCITSNRNLSAGFSSLPVIDMKSVSLVVRHRHLPPPNLQLNCALLLLHPVCHFINGPNALPLTLSSFLVLSSVWWFKLLNRSAHSWLLIIPELPSPLPQQFMPPCRRGKTTPKPQLTCLGCESMILPSMKLSACLIRSSGDDSYHVGGETCIVTCAVSSSPSLSFGPIINKNMRQVQVDKPWCWNWNTRVVQLNNLTSHLLISTSTLARVSFHRDYGKANGEGLVSCSVNQNICV